MISRTSRAASSSVGDSKSSRVASPRQAGPPSTLALPEATSSSRASGPPFSIDGIHRWWAMGWALTRSEEHTSELQSHVNLVCRLLLEKKNITQADVRDALSAAASVGDDRIQASTRGQVNPETWTHGSSAQRDTCFSFNDPATTEIYTLSLHDALPI